MTIYKCDRCGKTYETNPEPLFATDVMILVTKVPEHTQPVAKDLCKDCKNALQWWWKNITEVEV